MDAEPPRCTLQDAKAQEILDRRAVVSRDGDAAGAQRVGERTRAVAHERRFLARLGQVHGDGEPFPTRQLGRRPIQRLAHGVRRVWRYAQAGGVSSRWVWQFTSPGTRTASGNSRARASGGAATWECGPIAAMRPAASTRTAPSSMGGAVTG